MALSSGARMPPMNYYQRISAAELESVSASRAARFLRKMPTLKNPVLASGLSVAYNNSDPRRRGMTSALLCSSSSSNGGKRSHDVLQAPRFPPPPSSSSSSSSYRANRRRRAADLPPSEFFVGSNLLVLRKKAGPLQAHNKSAGVQFDCRVQATKEGAYLDDVPHLSEWLHDLPYYSNPVQDHPAYTAVRQYFVEEDDVVAKNVVVKMKTAAQGVYFRRAGPRQNVCFTGDEVRACIVTCGGLCPGLNTVIREIVCGLWTSYGVRDIIGIEGGYSGFYSNNTVALNPKVVNDIHKKGGTILRTSRGGHDKTKIVAAILDRGINQVYIIGGDGTQRGARVIYEELRNLGVKVVVAGIPKTIDNDIAVIDKSFGFDTAVEEAQRAINAAHVEAESVKNGVGLVKLMGRYSGYIAMYATLASRDVDCCLIPEVPFYLDGKGGLYEFVRRRLRENGHMVLVVAEGAGQELIAESAQINTSDASGNRLLLDVGLWLCQSLKNHFAADKKEALILKYIDPTYMIRAIPSNGSDNVYCTLLAHSAMHGAMAGYTGFTVGPVNGRHAYIPISTAVETQNQVNVTDRMWARLLSSTQQPDFLEYQAAIEEKRNSFAKAGKPSVVVDSKELLAEGPQNGSFREQKSKEADENVGASQEK